MTHVEKLKSLGACEEAVTFASQYNTFQGAWDVCAHPDWMLWIIVKESWLSDKELRLFAVRCARDVQHLMTDPRSIAALDVSERHANGEATDEELAAARAAAWAAASAAASAVASAAVRAAAWDVASAAASAAARDAAMDAAWDAARAAASAAARAAARDAAWAKQCGYIREMLPNPNF